MKYLILIAVVAAGIAAWLFPRAFPVVVLENRITAEEARQRADSFARVHELPTGVRVAVQFGRDDSLLTFIDLAGGGKDTIGALVRGEDVSPYFWSVRTMTPRDVRETRVQMAADGRIIGFERRLAEADERPALSPDSARAVADEVLTRWLGERPDRWRLAATSHETRKESNRLDQTFTFERTDRRVGGAPIRLDVVIAGDLPSEAHRYVEIPQAFRRRYSEMRSANELFSVVAAIALVGLLIAGALTLRRYARRHMVRWRAPIAVGAVVGALVAAAGLNELPTSWYFYNTATSPAVFVAQVVAGSLAAGGVLALVVMMTLAAAEVATRVAFPHHLDWWKLWQYRGTGEVARRVAGGYTLAAVALAYVVVFYLVTRRFFGWWVPAELLDDPNMIATPMPWLAGIAMSLQAAIWEEALFRALPLSLLSLWVGTRPGRGWWMAAGVVATALVFGFAHSDYPSWPAYSRGIEIFLDAVLWAVVFLRFGLIVTVVAHFLYNATLFSAFAASGDALPYRITAVVMGLVLAAPALAVGLEWLRQRRVVTAPEDARFAAWMPAGRPEAPPAPTYVPRTVGTHSTSVALALVAVGLVVMIVVPPRQPRGAEFTITRSDAGRIADSVLRTRGVQPEGWTRLVGTRSDTVRAWSNYLRRYDAESLAVTLASTYAVPAWWVVRYVRTEGPLAQREEEWRVRLTPDGVPRGVQRVVPDSAPGAQLAQGEARALARQALAAAGLDTTRVVETDLEETARPARMDVLVTFTDTTVWLPAGGAARAWVSIAGEDVVDVRRGVELPESFVRENIDRRMTRGLLAGVSGMALLALVTVGLVAIIRRRPPLLDDGELPRRTMFLAGAALLVSMLLSGLNALPSMLLDYDTAQPWETFVATTAIANGIGAILFILLVGALWMAANALRRRVGVPVVPVGAAGRSPYREAVTLGAGLGAVIAIASVVRNAVAAGIPRGPSTVMDQAVPLADGVISLPLAVFSAVPVVAIPLLLIVAVTRARSYRLLLGLLLVLLVGGVLQGTGGGGAGVGETVAAAIGLAAIAVAVSVWGGVSVVTWIAAALTLEALTGLRGALAAGSSFDRGSELLGVVAAVGVLLVFSRRGRVVGENRPLRGESAS